MALAKSIVVGVDFSDCSKAALRAAATLALETDSTLVIVHAFPGIQWTGILAGGMKLEASQAPQVEFQADVELEEALELTEKWANPLRKKGLTVVVEAKSARPARMLTEAAARHKASMVVVGTHGRTGLRRIGLGSVAQEVVRKSRTPILVVPLPEAKKRR